MKDAIFYDNKENSTSLSTLREHTATSLSLYLELKPIFQKSSTEKMIRVWM